MALNRRHFFQAGAATLGAASLTPAAFVPLPWEGTAGAAAPEPHFFLELFFPGGMDCLYTFDARPLAMTKAGLLANYLQEEPTPLTGRNGQTALTTSLTKPLRAHFDSFSVLNGVIMSRSFDGHDNNVNYLITGNPFGGESFLPHLNELGAPTPIDYVTSGGSDFAAATNTGNSVPLTPKAATALAARLAGGSGLTSTSPNAAYVQSRFAANSTGGGRFSAGAAAMAAGFRQVPGLAASLSQISPARDTDSAAVSLARLAGDLFRANLCRSVQVVFDGASLGGANLDTHDGASAAASPAAIGGCMESVAAVFQYLRETPFDAKQSLLDVTTVLVGTEFGRTMRQTFSPELLKSGTDHNPLKNTILLGGKGIKAGLIVGGTDMHTPDEVLSPAHLSMDVERLKTMGRPLDFRSYQALAVSPASYDPAAYLDFACIANTIYAAFGADTKHYRDLAPGLPKAQVLKGLLT